MLLNCVRLRRTRDKTNLTVKRRLPPEDLFIIKYLECLFSTVFSCIFSIIIIYYYMCVFIPWLEIRYIVINNITLCPKLINKFLEIILSLDMYYVNLCTF